MLRTATNPRSDFPMIRSRSGAWSRFGRRLAVAGAAMSMAAGVACAQSAAPEIDSLLSLYSEYGLLNGSVLVAQSGEVILSRGYGEADMSWHVPNAPDTKFRIGSTTKQFTAALVLTLVEEGKIDLDGEVRDYLPTYPSPQGQQVRIRHLLSHTSGIPSYTTPEFMSNGVRDPFDVASLVKEFSDRDLLFEPGERWSYSNSNYILLGAIVESVTGERYEDALRTRVLDPLGLQNTGYEHNSDILERQAAGYVKTWGGYSRALYLDTGVPYAAGMLYSTVEDLFRWDQALYGVGPFQESDTKDVMFSPHAPVPAELVAEGLPPWYGFGVFVGKIALGTDSVMVTQHGGSIFGFRSGFWRMPNERNTIIVLDNSSSDAVAEIGRSIMMILYGHSVEPPKQPVAYAMYDRISAEGLAKAVDWYRMAVEKESERFDFGESQLNRLGLHYMSNGRLEEAIDVLKLNVERYPASANVYDSLAETYLLAGKRELAVENYRRVLGLSPGHANASQKLEQLTNGR